MMAHLLQVLETGHDIGYYSRLVFAIEAVRRFSAALCRVLLTMERAPAGRQSCRRLKPTTVVMADVARLGANTTQVTLNMRHRNR